MKITKRAKREAKQLYRFCLVGGLLDENRVRQIVQRAVAISERDCPSILAHFLRLVKLDCAQRTATIESATPLPVRTGVDHHVRRAPGVDWRDADSGGMRCL
jgi:F-type H+-transporting ATPase subunit delta